MATIICHTCEQRFPDYKSLAAHILAPENKKTHRKGRRWAAKMMCVNTLSPDKRVGRKKQNGLTLTDDDRINRASTRRELSGKTEYAQTVCPHCNESGGVYLEVEYLKDPLTWRIGDRLVVLCSGCRR